MLAKFGVSISDVILTGAFGEKIIECSGHVFCGHHWEEIKKPELLFLSPRINGSNYIDPASRAGLAAARILSNKIPSTPPEQLGCIIGSRTCNAFSVALCEQARLSGRRVSPIIFAHAGWNVPVACIANELNCHGFTSTLCCGASSGVEAAAYARMVLERNRAKTLLCGIVEIQLDPIDSSASIQIRAVGAMCVLQLGHSGSQHADFGPIDELPVKGHDEKFRGLLAFLNCL